MDHYQRLAEASSLIVRINALDSDLGEMLGRVFGHAVAAMDAADSRAWLAHMQTTFDGLDARRVAAVRENLAAESACEMSLRGREYGPQF